MQINQLAAKEVQHYRDRPGYRPGYGPALFT